MKKGLFRRAVEETAQKTGFTEKQIDYLMRTDYKLIKEEMLKTNIKDPDSFRALRLTYFGIFAPKKLFLRKLRYKICKEKERNELKKLKKLKELNKKN